MTLLSTRRANRDAARTAREGRTIPSHASALFLGASLEIAKQDAKLTVALEALHLIADDEQMAVGARAVARGALDRIGGMR